MLTDETAPELLAPPVNVLRLALHPDGMGGRVENLADWGRHIVESLRAMRCGVPTPGWPS